MQYTIIVLCLCAILLLEMTNLIANPLIHLLLEILAMTAASLICLVESGVYLWHAWLRWAVPTTASPDPTTVYAEVLRVRLDPVQGIVMDVLDQQRTIHVLVNPQYWHLLPSSTISRKDGLESAVLRSRVTAVAPDAEPASLITITNGEDIIGMGSRVVYHGRSYLLTANHVWNGSSPRIFLAKGKEQCEVSIHCNIARGSFDLAVDFVLVEIPDNIWSRLRVKSANFVPLKCKSVVTCFGGSPTKLVCSSGCAYKGDYSQDIIHTCSTTENWSGTPLYCKGSVVGVHCGQHAPGVSNRAVNAGALLNLVLESDFSDMGITRIDEDEALLRDYEFTEVDMINQGRLGIGKGEYFNAKSRGDRYDDFYSVDNTPSEAGDYHRMQSSPFAHNHEHVDRVDKFEREAQLNNRLLWANVETSVANKPSIDIPLPPAMRAPRRRRLRRELVLETSPENIPAAHSLNCQRAETTPSLPSSTSVDTNSCQIPPLSAPATACPSISLESRIASLEKELQKLTPKQLTVRRPNSRRSATTTGQNAAQQRNSLPSESKPAVSKPLPPHQVYKQRVIRSPPSTPDRVQGVACETPGTSKSSPLPSRLNAAQTSTSKPHQASH